MQKKGKSKNVQQILDRLKRELGAEQDSATVRAKAGEGKVEVGSQMEENEGGGAGGGGTGTRTYSHIWWALASAAQLGWAISSFKRGHAGDSHFMPFKAFSVASLFVGATATAAVSVLHVSGIHKVEDLLEVGANIRTGLGVRPRARDK
ncbi:uncharacterized protein LOC115983455 [Quercus lobata]|uniref:uncharacterized protein LOC115983202 n=1 Tax=Quercus lobata TaxID=97700 RepID=UPI0012491F40|nr:uncharacterized protein LOC115983202 [Quercus lobata]XP_030961991.1 uncharacterized protein LOC115983455 [Quercus lobata]